ncbi:MAG: hypothetical protein IJX63_10060 [Lachnospiraceae bacterium]|nr:hypothetical protein [Lachnospiraceae bacterium]
MEHKLLVLCDPEEDYAQHMADFLRRKKESVWEIVAFTRPEELLKLEEEIEILIISEAAYDTFVHELPAKLKILLNESGIVQENELVNIDKYQEAEKVRLAILECYMKLEREFFPRLGGDSCTKLIGMFSPVRRCLQTTFALTYGQLLAEKYRTLYISFEHYNGIEEWQDCMRQDLSALLYYQQSEGTEFGLHIQTIVQRIGNLEYVAPIVNGDNLLYITMQEWQNLLKGLMEYGRYEYIILDLSESMQGLFEILRMCTKVYTIVQEDVKAQCKLNQYEQLLASQEYEDVRNKTAKCRLPVFRKLPESVEQYSKGELAEYIKGMLGKEPME